MKAFPLPLTSAVGLIPLPLAFRDITGNEIRISLTPTLGALLPASTPQNFRSP